MNKKELFMKAKKGDISILKDPDVSEVKDRRGFTALHYLAEEGRMEILGHPDTGKVVNNFGNTPLHILSMLVVSWGREILNHPEVDVIKNSLGRTPRDIMLRAKNIWYSVAPKGGNYE